MSIYQVLSILSALAITIAFLNQYTTRMQTTIAITSGALAISVIMLVMGKTLWPELEVILHHGAGQHYRTDDSASQESRTECGRQRGF